MDKTLTRYTRIQALFLCLILAVVFVLPGHRASFVYSDSDEAYDQISGETTPGNEADESLPSLPADPDEGGEEDSLPEGDPLPPDPQEGEESCPQEGDPLPPSPDEERGEQEGESEGQVPEEEISHEIPARNFTKAGPLLFEGTPQKTPSYSTLGNRGGQTSEGLFLDKDASYDEDTGLVTIDLEAYTTGEVHISEQAIPTDICLVLDQSGSMQWAFGDTTRQAALKTAVTTFINKVEENAIQNNVTHRIGIVTFSGTATVQRQLTSNYSNLRSYISGLPASPTGATNTQDGMAKAINVMNGALAGNNKIVIMFTDGEPTTQSTFSTSVANGAIAHAKTLKDNQTTVYSVGIFDGADPRVMWGNNTYYPGEFNPNSNGTLNSKWRETASKNNPVEYVDIPAANRFMNLLSSNSASANNLGLTRRTGTNFSGYQWIEYEITTAYPNPLDKTGYFLSANNPAALEDIFKTIAEQIEVPTIDLGSETIILDAVTDHFVAPAGGINPVAYLADCTGSTEGVFTFGTPYSAPATVTVSVDSVTQKIEVTGFDFNANFVSETPREGTSPPDYGRKLIIRFQVMPDPSFFGGNGIETNKADSGVYVPGNPDSIGTFPQPEVDIPLNYQVQDEVIQKEYLGNPVDIGHAVVFKTSGGISFQPDGINNDHVDITYSIYDTSGTILLGTYVVPHGVAAVNGFWDGLCVVPELDTNTYRIKVSVAPMKSGKYGALDLNFDLTVFRYRPVIETLDETVYLGQTVNLLGNSPIVHYRHVGWKCKDNVNSTNIHGYEPELTLLPVYVAGTDPGTYPTGWNAFRPLETTEFKALVSWANSHWPDRPQNVDVTGDCWWKRGAEVSHPNAALSFWIYLKTCSITVTKEAAAGTVIGSNESFMVDVKDSQGQVWRLRLNAGTSVTLTGLPIGTYTISEDSVWSWQYTGQVDPVSVELKANASEDHASILVTNEKTIRKWITGETFIMNLFKGLGETGGGP